jgi:glycosyltransferase involved in cell wall biosynthesis
MPDPRQISAIVTTHNRAGLLRRVLDGFHSQTLCRDQWEIVVVDDGSTDGTAEVLRSFAGALPLRAVFQRHTGLAAARNHGVLAAWSPIVCLLDDDDIPAPDFLAEHLGAHQIHPDPSVAVLNHTELAPDIAVNAVMEYVTGTGGHLFSYAGRTDGELLDFTYFWGGRISCKRRLLWEHGLFDPVFQFGCEDIELGYRLSRVGLRVRYHARAVTRMARQIGFDSFCDRLRLQGRSQYVFSRLHDDPRVRAWTRTEGFGPRWRALQPRLGVGLRAARELDRLVEIRHDLGLNVDGTLRRLLHTAYCWAFEASNLQGIANQFDEDTKRTHRSRPGLSELAAILTGPRR